MTHGAFQRLKEEIFAPVGWIEYSLDRKIVLNDSRTLVKLNFNSQNELVFSYLYENAGRIITLAEIETNATREPLRKTLHEFVRAFGFTGRLREFFFDVSKNTIRFRKEIYSTDIPTNAYWILQHPLLKFYELI